MITNEQKQKAFNFFIEAHNDFNYSPNKQIIVNRIRNYLLSNPELNIFLNKKDSIYSEFKKPNHIDTDMSIALRHLKPN